MGMLHRFLPKESELDRQQATAYAVKEEGGKNRQKKRDEAEFLTTRTRVGDGRALSLNLGRTGDLQGGGLRRDTFF